MTRPFLRRAALWALALTAAACGPEIPGDEPGAAPHKAVAAPKAAAADDDSAEDSYVYDPKGRRDPFQNTFKEHTGRTYIHEGLKSRPKQALQLFDLDQLKLKLTMTGTSSPVAYILDPNGKSHLVRIGDFVGKHWGKVSHIGPEELVITETLADQQTGKVSFEHLPLKMAQTEAEKASKNAFEAGPAGGSK